MREPARKGMAARPGVIIVKTPAEIQQMRLAGVLAAEALREVVRAVRPGVTGMQLNTIAERYIRAHGGIPSFLGYRGFPASICISVNDEVVHGIPDGTPLRAGALVSLDLGAVVDGFHGDVAVTVPVGEVGPKLHRLVHVTREALSSAIDVVRPGARLGGIGAAGQRHVEAGGFSGARGFARPGIGRGLPQGPPGPNVGE